jgi:hypothetical protein
MDVDLDAGNGMLEDDPADMQLAGLHQGAIRQAHEPPPQAQQQQPHHLEPEQEQEQEPDQAWLEAVVEGVHCINGGHG